MKTLQIVFKSIFQMVIALGLGYCFSVALMKGLLPDSWAMPDTILSAIAIFFVIQWMRGKDVAPEGAIQRANKARQSHTLVAQLMASDQRHVFRAAKSKVASRKMAGRSGGQARCAGFTDQLAQDKCC
ncbi:hypothetical protein EON80_02230 [bacterium]|nr:MAG: hypothetical protein EON80_02230 [bacterium]